MHFTMNISLGIVNGKNLDNLPQGYGTCQCTKYSFWLLAPLLFGVL